MKRYCLKCKNSFEPVRKSHVFCSSKCRTESWKINHYWKDTDFNSHDYHNTTPVNSFLEKVPVFKVEEGKIFTLLKKEKLNEQLWIFANSILWPLQDFSETEQNLFKKIISENYFVSENLDQNFRELVERIVLAKRYVIEKPYRYIAQPSDYFNPKFYNGLKATEKWYQALQDQKETSARFGESLEIFSEAIFNYATKQNILDVIFYRQIFINLETTDLLQWYMNAVMHFQFLHY